MKLTLASLAVIIAFTAGLLVGAYYLPELQVWLRHLAVSPATPTASPSPAATASPLVPRSVLELPGLDQPLPLVYSDTLEEARLQEYLKEGAVVLPLGTAFGEPGNVVITAHSSGTQAFGPYRFAFARLAELEAGQEYTIVTLTARYTYRVYGKEIVWPHEVNRLPRDNRSTVTLVTCWPLWTNFKRLLVHTELVNIERQL